MYRRKQKATARHVLSTGPTPDAIPNLPLAQWKREVVSAYTGPNTGLTRLELGGSESAVPSSTETIGGVTDWNNPSEFAYGMSLSLYEENRTKTNTVQINGETREIPCIVGDPVADVFAVVVRENNAILAVADGSGWGLKPRLAARCAVNAAVSHVTENMEKMADAKKPTSATLVKVLRESIDAAHLSILQHGGTLTTLSVAVACQMQSLSKSSSKSSHLQEEWGLFVVSVGDSPVYVYCPHSQKAFDVTVGCHPKNGIRKVQISGGALGPAIGTLPDLENLSLAYFPIYPGDIVMLMSDGISDNFSPQVLRDYEEESQPDSDSDSGIVCSESPNLSLSRFNHKARQPVTPSPLLLRRQCSDSPASSRQDSPSLSNVRPSDTPRDSPHADLHCSSSADISKPTNDMEFSMLVADLPNCCENTQEITQFLRNYQNILFDHISAQTVVASMINFVRDVTESKRSFRADCLEKGIDVVNKKRTDPEFAKQMGHFKSKLDHATIVSYSVGRH